MITNKNEKLRVMEKIIRLYKELSILHNKPHYRITCKSLYRRYLKNEFSEDNLALLLKYENKKIADFFTKKSLELYKDSKNYLNSYVLYSDNYSLCIIDSELLRIIRFEILCYQWKDIEYHLQKINNNILLNEDKTETLPLNLDDLEKNTKNNNIPDIMDSIKFFQNNLLLKSINCVKHNYSSIKIYIKRIQEYKTSNFEYYKLLDQ